ncbi:MAG: pitrilysin family protein, partial [Alphaproteobacteria bacterium]|nr:pitrilysin family protein [Alphaproteobacteria bacterium]
GLAVLTTSLLTQGAGPYTDRDFQEKLAAHAIQMDISASRDQIVGQLKTLSRTQKEAFKLLGLALTKPRFEQQAFDRVRDEQLTSIKFQLSSPSWQGRYALYQTIFGTHPYGYRSLGMPQTLAVVTRDDAASFAQEHLAKDNLYVSVVGDIDASTLSSVLDQVFGALPDHAVLAAVPEVVWPNMTKTLLVSRQGKQTNILFTRPMLRREKPDWYAAEIANYILGGGGFTARLMKAVRAKEGLTYGISTGLSSMDHASMLVGAFSTDNAKAHEAMALLKKVWQNFYDNGVTQTELDAARDYLMGSMPISLTSTDAISQTLLAMQTEKLGQDYLDRHAALLQAVTKADVDRVIQEWFDPAKMSASFVGVPKGFSFDDKRELITE